jgi:hypothetical protein
LLDRYLRKEIELGDRSGKAVHLLFSANRWECAYVAPCSSSAGPLLEVKVTLVDVNPCRAEIEALLATGTSVVCDRYAFSGLAFSMAKVRRFRPALRVAPLAKPAHHFPPLQGLDQSFLQTPDTGLPLPDVTLFLTLSAQEAARRGSYGEERCDLPFLAFFFADRPVEGQALMTGVFDLPRRAAGMSSKHFRRSSAPSSTLSAPRSTRRTAQTAGSRSTLEGRSTTSASGSGSSSRAGSGLAGRVACGSGQRRTTGRRENHGRSGRIRAIDDLAPCRTACCTRMQSRARPG